MSVKSTLFAIKFFIYCKFLGLCYIFRWVHFSNISDFSLPSAWSAYNCFSCYCGAPNTPCMTALEHSCITMWQFKVLEGDLAIPPIFSTCPCWISCCCSSVRLLPSIWLLFSTILTSVFSCLCVLFWIEVDNLHEKFTFQTFFLMV